MAEDEVFSRPKRGRPKGSKADVVILKGAATAFAELGYANCRIEDILLHAKASRTNFYRHFSSKDDVYRQLVVRELRFAEKKLTKVIAGFLPSETLEDRIQKLIEADVDVALAAGPFLRVMFRETGNIDGYQALWGEKTAFFKQMIAGIFTDAGLSRPDELLVEAVLTAIEHVLVSLHDLPITPDKKAERGVDLIARLFQPLIAAARINTP